MVDIQAEVQKELHKIHHTRNRIGYFPNPLSLFISIYFQKELFADHRWWWVLGLVVFGTVLRIVIGELFFDQWARGVKWARLVNLVAFTCLGIGWGLHFADVHFHYGADSSHVSYTLLIIVAFITGSSTSLLADKVSYYVFTSCMAILVVGTYLADPRLSNAYIILNVVLYMFFSMSNYKIAHKQLCDLLGSQIKAEHEKLRMQKIINTVPGFVGFIDRNHVCYLANSTTLLLYPDIVGKKIGSLDPNSNWEKDVIDFMASDKNTEVFEEETIFRGETIHAILNVQRLEDGGVVVVSIIITELVEAKKQIREQEGKAQYAAKLASLGEMAAGIAHEVNNPLSIIQGSANIIRRLVNQTPIDIENVKLLTTKMIDTSDRISKTIKGLKALSRNAENDPKEIVSLNSIIYKTMDIVEPRFKQSGVELKCLCSQEDLPVLAREAELLQVFTNLLGNALDAVKDLDERWAEIKVEKSGHYLNVYFTDSGKGIPPEIRKKIMEPFFTTKDVNQGTGLGLSISKNIIQNHDGDLTLLEDAPNTSFKIRLPIVETRAVQR